jgi:aspartate beta-hydroxylase
VDLATALGSAVDHEAARSLLELHLQSQPESTIAWLVLGQQLERAGDSSRSLRAFYEAVTRSQCAKRWVSADSTPPHLLDLVFHAVGRVRKERIQLLRQPIDQLAHLHGPRELRRVEKALSIFLKIEPADPPSVHQRARFLYVPDLPAGPYHDPNLQPWAERLAKLYQPIREEACRILAEDGRWADFLTLRPGMKPEDYLLGQGHAPAWEALFFYRNGRRYADTHARCPVTSAFLESTDLCRIEDEAPEICFSVLRAGTTILPHHGVTNVRLVMHLPLIAPPQCALHVFGAHPHEWREGELVMFDDTYKHEAWNRSDSIRIVLLMDCWNPHLSSVERAALTDIIGMIRRLSTAARAAA